MAGNESFPQTGIVVPEGGKPPSSMDTYAHAIVDDVFRNIIYDIVLKTHREEKISRARTAAIIVEQKAAEQEHDSSYDDSTGGSEKKLHVETAAAIYDDGNIYIKGNPLATTKEIRCAKCGLPRLLHPTDGNGGRKPEPDVEYCKKHPFIDKPGHDIHGQPFPVEGPGKGHKRKKEDLPESSQDGKTPAPSFPNVKCHVCSRFLNVRRFAKHLEQCMGIKSRASGRAALLKINNGNTSQSGTPPGSRKGTPLPAAAPKRSSPTKRVAEDMDDGGDSDDSPKKKKPKKNVVKLKAPKASVIAAATKPTSQLSFEHKVESSDDKIRKEATSAVPAPTKKLVKPVGSGGKGSAPVKKWKSGRETVNGKTRILPPPSVPGKTTEVKNISKGVGGDSTRESSQTASSPS